jgi:hypothetical protein
LTAFFCLQTHRHGTYLESAPVEAEVVQREKGNGLVLVKGSDPIRPVVDVSLGPLPSVAVPSLHLAQSGLIETNPRLGVQIDTVEQRTIDVEKHSGISSRESGLIVRQQFQPHPKICVQQSRLRN